MKQTKKLGRGLEDFSHLFLSSPSDAKKPLPDPPQGSLEHKKVVGAPSRSLCVVSHRALDQRAFLVIHLALEIAQQGKKVLLLDGDFSMPRLTMRMQDCIATPLSHLITRHGRDLRDVQETNGVKLISLDVDLSTLSALGQDERRSLKDSFNTLEEESDVILTVASPGFMHHMKALVCAVDEAMVITPQPLAEMINAYGLIKLIFHMRENVRVGIVSCNLTNALQAAMVFEKMKRVVDKFLHKPLVNYGFIPDGGEIVAPQKTGDHRSPQTFSHNFTSVTEIIRTIFEMDPGNDCALYKDSIAPGFSEKLFAPSRH